MNAHERSSSDFNQNWAAMEEPPGLVPRVGGRKADITPL